MSFKAEVVADSTNKQGKRITTMVVTFPRIILAEFNTHRMFSRNSASSRAIPFAKMVKSVEENPFIPIAWQKDHKGMQGTEYLTEFESGMAVVDWKRGLQNAINDATTLSRKGITKQLCNRKLETYMWHTVIVTATEWENFFALRCGKYQLRYKGDRGDGSEYHVARSRKEINLEKIDHFINKQGNKVYPIKLDWTDFDWLQVNQGAAEIHMMKIAEMMWDTYRQSTPKLLEGGEWHIPYGDRIDETTLQLEILDDLNKRDGTMERVKISTVMAARTSYTVVGEDLKPLTYKRMIEIHNNMATADPKHMSPFEHCAQNPYVFKNGIVDIEPKLESNLKGWIQYRKMIPGENITT